MKKKTFLISAILLFTNILLKAAFPQSPLSGGGSGTQIDPYIIKTPTDLFAVANAVNIANGNSNSVADAYYELAADIDMSVVQWSNSIGNTSNYFKGHFDGKGFKIKNLNFGSITIPNTTSITAGLFGNIQNATISNLEINVQFYLSCNVTQISSLSCGGLVATIDNGINVIDNCKVNGNIHVSLSGDAIESNIMRIGGVVGHNNFNNGNTTTKIINCRSDVQITGKNSVTLNSGVVNCGGILGDNSTGTILEIGNCFSLGSIIGSSDNFTVNVGGIIGNNNNIISTCKIYNCYAANMLDAVGNENTNVGGIAGSFTSYEGNKIDNCTALNTVISGKLKSSLDPSVNRIIGFSGLNLDYGLPSVLPGQSDLKVKAMSVNVTPVYAREGNEVELAALIYNKGLSNEEITTTIVLPNNVELVKGKISFKTIIPALDSTTSILKWIIKPKQKGIVNYEIIIDNGINYSKTQYSLEIREPYIATKENYVPSPNTISSGDYMLGAFRCPLWYEKTRPGCWDIIANNYPERAPVLGYYNEASPEVVDWDIKYALEHGVSFFMDCWYRTPTNLGKSPIVAYIDHWLTAYLNSQYKEQMKFALMWVNIIKTNSTGISSESDLIDNLLPYWIENYFKKSSYLKIDNKPVLNIYNYTQFITDLGGNANTKAAILKMREACVAAGFSGLHLITTHQSNYTTSISYLKDVGFDAITSYHVPTFTGKMNAYNPPSQIDIVNIQETCWNEIKRISTMETYPVASMGWDDRPWKPYGSPKGWYLEPSYYKKVCKKAKSFSDLNSTSRKIIMLDNWNEFGEGHYIAPTQQFGFSYLDAIREVFTTNPIHNDLAPEDVGRGSYRFPYGEVL